jgi:hypothetical protein
LGQEFYKMSLGEGGLIVLGSEEVLKKQSKLQKKKTQWNMSNGQKSQLREVPMDKAVRI